MLKKKCLLRLKPRVLERKNTLFRDFDLDLEQMRYVPIDILIKNMLDSREEAQLIKGDVIDFDTVIPEKVLVDGIRD